MDPTVQSLANDLPVRDVDINEHPEIGEYYKILSKPTALILRDGKVVATIKGARTEDEYRAEFKAVCSDSQSIVNADL